MVGNKKKSSSRSVKAGVLFPISRMHRYLRSKCFKYRISAVAPVYQAAVLEYLTAEILELAGNAAVDYKKKRITPRHIFLAIANDEELHQLLKHVTISSGGVMPHIHRELLNEKSANAKKNTVLPTKNSAQRVAKVTSITSKRATKPTSKAAKNVADKKGKTTNKIVNNKSTGSGLTILSEKTLHLGQKLRVVQGNLVDVVSDVVVCPTNNSFFMGGEVATIIQKIGGKALMDEIASLHAAHGNLNVADAALCPAHLPNAQFMIACNGPTWKTDNAEQLLEQVIARCLSLADSKSLSTIALPSIGSGRAGFPKQLAAQTILRSIRNYFISSMASSLKSVYFVLYDPESIAVYTSELAKLDN